MTEIELVLEAIRSAIEDGEAAAAIYDFPPDRKARHTLPVVSVGLKSGAAVPSGFMSYMGLRHNALTDTYSEVYSKRLKLTVSLDMRCPADGVTGGTSCAALFSRVIHALDGVSSGIKVGEVTCGDVTYDRNADAYLCRAEAVCEAVLFAEKSEESGEFTDFILRGDLVG